jgi:hypothetical protein
LPQVSRSYTRSSGSPIRRAAAIADTAAMRVRQALAPAVSITPIMRQKLLNRTTLDVLLVLLFVAWVL